MNERQVGAISRGGAVSRFTTTRGGNEQRSQRQRRPSTSGQGEALDRAVLRRTARHPHRPRAVYSTTPARRTEKKINFGRAEGMADCRRRWGRQRVAPGSFDLSTTSKSAGPSRGGAAAPDKDNEWHEIGSKQDEREIERLAVDDGGERLVRRRDGHAACPLITAETEYLRRTNQTETRQS